VPLPVLHDFALTLPPDISVEVSESQFFLLSADPPSWVSLLATFDWWFPLKAGATVFAAELMKEAAKDTWKNKAAIASWARRTTGEVLHRLATSIAQLKSRLSRHTSILIGLPVPDEHFGARLALSDDGPDAMLFEIAVLVAHLPALRAFLETESPQPIAGFILSVGTDGSLEVSWLDRASLNEERRVLHIGSTTSDEER
jgi:hypothetical protein